MTQSEPGKISLEEFALIAERAELGMSQQELQDLKPLFEINLQHIRLLRSLDLEGQEIEMTFHPEGPDS